jgi:hypothetical protein
MLAITSAHLELGGGWVPRPAKRREPLAAGALCSTLLHIAVALLLILGPTTDTRPPPDIEEAIPAELVSLGESAAPVVPQPAADAPLAPVEPPRPEPPKPLPLAKSPPVAPKAEPAKPRLGPTPLARSEAEPAAPPLPPAPAADPSFTEFKEGQTIEQNAPDINATPLAGARVASSQPTTGAGAVPGQASYDVRDYIRIQIERRWRFDARAPGAADWAVRIHLVVDRDGTVVSADIVPDPRLDTDPQFRAFAFSARDAVLVSSPLRLPPGTPPGALDMVLRFEAHTALR